MVLYLLWLVLYLSSGQPTMEDTMQTFAVTSPAFGYGEPIPIKYTCDGEDISPPLIWENVPEEAKSLVLMMVDPDAPGGIFTHWIVYNLPPADIQLPEGVNLKVAFADSVIKPQEGLNDFGRIGYGGPCPPPGPPHRYYFRLFAIDSLLKGVPGVRRQALLSAIQGHVLAEAEHMGIYKRGR